MREAVLYIAISVDGYIADEQGGIEWLEFPFENPVEDNSYEEFYAGIGTVIMGRTTYDQVINELSPDNYPYESVDSYVLTSRKGEPRAKVTFTNEDVVDLVIRLKKETGKSIWIVGGSSVVMPLIESNVIDCFQLAQIPVLLGKGIPLFRNFATPINLVAKKVDLVNGVIYTEFEKA